MRSLDPAFAIFILIADIEDERRIGRCHFLLQLLRSYFPISWRAGALRTTAPAPHALSLIIAILCRFRDIRAEPLFARWEGETQGQV